MARSAQAQPGVKSSTCKHGTEIRAAGRKHHPVSFHLHGFSHNHHITEEPLAGKTPEKTKIISEFPARQKATSLQAKKVEDPPLQTRHLSFCQIPGEGPLTLQLPASITVCLQSKAWILPRLQPCLWFCFPRKKTWEPN